MGILHCFIITSQIIFNKRSIEEKMQIVSVHSVGVHVAHENEHAAMGSWFSSEILVCGVHWA